MKKNVEAKLLHKLRWMAGHTTAFLDRNAAISLRNTACEIILETWPNEPVAEEVKEWQKKGQ